MSMEKIQQALVQAYQTAFPLWLPTRTAWENVAFLPPKDATAWMSFRFMPVDSRIATLGPTGRDTDEGMLQIDLHSPIGSGEGVTRQTISLLRNCFRPQVLAYGGQAVTILSRSRSNGRTSNGFYMIPFTVRWRAQTTRT